MRLFLCVLFATAIASACQRPSTTSPALEDVLDDFMKESGVSFADCEFGGLVACQSSESIVTGMPEQGFSQSSQCIVDSWKGPCTAAQTELYWEFTNTGNYLSVRRNLFVAPQDGKCRLSIFEQKFGAEVENENLVTHFECADLVEMGICGVLEPLDCSIVDVFEVAREPGPA